MSASAVNRLARGVVAVAIASVLAGCGGSSSAEDPSATATTTDGLTPPGTSLTIGQTATVPLDEGAGVIELAVVSIEEGDPGALSTLQGTPYYVRLEAKAVSGDADQFFVETYFRAFAGDAQVAPIASPLTVGTCERDYFGPGSAPGTTLDTCLTYVVDDGAARIDRIEFDNRDGYQTQDETAVGWS